jgi:hypothetical protein
MGGLVIGHELDMGSIYSDNYLKSLAYNLIIVAANEPQPVNPLRVGQAVGRSIHCRPRAS